MISTPVQLRFGDFDMANHVHNAAYLHYFETARIHFFTSELGENWDWRKEGIILKKNLIDYHVPIRIEDKIQVEVRTTHIGTKSFTLSYTIVSENEERMTYGESVLVCFNHHDGHTIEIPHQIREVLEKHLSEQSQ